MKSPLEAILDYLREHGLVPSAIAVTVQSGDRHRSY
jgi:hypothetical protein